MTMRRSFPARITTRRGTQALAAFACLALAAFSEPPVSPEHTLRYTAERGGSCTVMIPYYGPENLWIGRFSGRKPLDVSAERVFDDNRSGESCFFLRQDCERWVTFIRSVYSQGAGFAYCQFLGAREPVSRGRGVVIKP